MAERAASDAASGACPVCATPLPPGYRFCGGCGHRVADGPSSSEVGSGSSATAPAAASGEGSPPRRGPRRRVVAGGLAVAVVLAGVVVAVGREPAPLPLAAAARGDAGRTGVFTAPDDADLARRHWRDRWTQAAPRDRQGLVTPVPVDDDVLVAVTGAVARLDGDTGTIAWRVELDVSPGSAPYRVDDRLVAVAGEHEVTLLDVVDGTRLWSAPTPELDGRRGLAAVGRTLGVTGDNGTVVLLDLAHGTRTATLLARDLLDTRGPFTADLAPVAVGDRLAVVLRRTDEDEATVVLIEPSGELVWRGEERVRPWDPPLVGDGVLVAADEEGIVALDLETGRTRWRWRAAAGEEPGDLHAAAVDRDGRRVLLISSWPIRRVLDTRAGTLVVSENAEPLVPSSVGAAPHVDADGRVAMPTAAGAVAVVDVATGRTVASPVSSTATPAVPVVLGSRVVLGLAGGVVAARPLAGDGPVWTAEVTPAAACPVVVGRDVVVVAEDPLRAADAADGRRMWTAGDDVPLAGEVAAADGTVVSVDQVGYASARDATTGERRWHEPVGGQPLGSPVVAGDTVVVAGGTGVDLALGGSSGYVRALALEDGARRWFRPTAGRVTFPPAAGDDVVVLVTATGMLQGLDVATGEDRWPVHDLGAPPAAPPVVRGDHVVVTTADEVRTYRVDAGGVEEVAVTRVPIPLRRAPAVTADAVVLRLDPTTVVALDLADHRLRWRTSVADSLTTPPTVAGDRVLVGGQRGVHVLDLADGSVEAMVGPGAVVGQLGVSGHGFVACTAAGELVAHG